jgi:hypothetical protein
MTWENLPYAFGSAGRANGVIRLDISTKKHPDMWALVDEEDWLAVRVVRWSATRRKKSFYVRGWVNGGAIFLHRYLLNPPDDMVVDHLNGNPLDNTRANIKICTIAENNITSGYRQRGKTEGKPHRVRKRLASGEIKIYEYAPRTKSR